MGLNLLRAAACIVSLGVLTNAALAEHSITSSIRKNSGPVAVTDSFQSTATCGLAEPPVATILVAPSHGRLSTSVVTEILSAKKINQTSVLKCEGKRVKIRFVKYRPASNYSGPDGFRLEWAYGGAALVTQRWYPLRVE